MRKSKIKIFKKISKIKNQNFFKNQKSKFFKIPVMNTNTTKIYNIHLAI